MEVKEGYDNKYNDFVLYFAYLHKENTFIYMPMLSNEHEYSPVFWFSAYHTCTIREHLLMYVHAMAAVCIK